MSSSIIYYLLLIELAVTVYYSIRGRRSRDILQRAIFFARMNIMIGVLFLTMSFAQLFTTSYNQWLIMFAIVVMIIGLFNLFVGIRNHGIYTRLSKTEKLNQEKLDNSN
jgi:hypothetical protein